VTAVAIPSRYNDPRSTECARELCTKLGVAFEVVPLEPLFTAAEGLLGPLIRGPEGGVTVENLQARLRMVVLMSYVNRHGGMLLNTSNKTELSLGYGTLYADLAGALCVIGDLTKPQVYSVARWYDAGRGVIPPFVIERPPSAELRPDQVDPFDYPRISPVAEALVQDTALPPEATREEIDRCRKLMRSAEHKRWQSGIVLKVSEKAFGTGRMMPVTKV
jgi:NAD+ synthase (glutamine-hydrolysing)